MVEVREAPVPVMYWHSHDDNDCYVKGLMDRPTEDEVSSWIQSYPGAIKILLSNGQIVIVRAKK